ncbi:MAG: helix-turn-helix domain-containing protein [Tannerella sp.]|jgi:AraC-like DNA-binding protein|nr:helix-turn-helix domain-containing protein [Tannerella sp.]
MAFIFESTPIYAKAMGVPPGLFASTIQTLTGKFVIECIRQYTDMTVCELLRKTHLPLGEVAKKAGFTSSLSAFSQFFIRMHNCSAREWRWQEAGE